MKIKYEVSQAEFTIVIPGRKFLVRWERLTDKFKGRFTSWKVSCHVWRKSSFEQYDPSCYMPLNYEAKTSVIPSQKSSIEFIQLAIKTHETIFSKD